MLQREDKPFNQIMEIKATIKHYMNPLHIYCRLRDLGLAKGPACFLCRIYERAILKKFFLIRG
jgi:hypothetical protein